MKKILSILFTAFIVLSLAMPTFAADDYEQFNYLAEKADKLGLRGTEINVYNWGEYIADGKDGSVDVNHIFEEVTGIKINYSCYDTNEDMYTKLKSGGTSYDIVIPSDYMIARLINEGMLEKIDFTNIQNYGNILDEYKDLYFDPTNEYSIPYNVGMIGVIYNKTMVDPEDLGSWDLMWNPKYKDSILQYNNPRDGFATAQFLLGLDINSEDKTEWEKAYSKMVEQKPLVQAYVADEVFSKMESGDAAVGSYYAGDYLLMADVNPDLGFYYPKEGTNVFVDSVCIPKGTQNKAGAELYIDFLMDGEIALENAEYLCYATPNGAVLENEDYSLRDEECLYPSEGNIPERAYYHNLNSDMLDFMSDKWNNLKIEGGSNYGMYVGMSVVVALSAGAIVFSAIRKKKRSKLYDV